MFGHFWPQKDFFEPPCAHDWRLARVKTASNQLRICLRIMHVRRIPKVSIYMAVTTKLVTEKAKKCQKWQDFGQNRAIIAGSWHGRYLFINIYGSVCQCAQLFHSFTVYVSVRWWLLMIRGLDRGEVYPKFAFLQMRWRKEIFLDNLDWTMLATSTMVNNLNI